MTHFGKVYYSTMLQKGGEEVHSIQATFFWRWVGCDKATHSGNCVTHFGVALNPTQPTTHS